MDDATRAFWDELSKESAQSPVPGKKSVRVRPAGMVPDEGIVQMQKATQRKNLGRGGFDSATDIRQLKDKRQQKVQPGQPASPWRLEKVSEDERKRREFLLDAETNPIHLANEMNAAYGREWLDWEPETLWETIRKDWKTYPNEESKNKLMAIKVVMANEYFWNEWEVFEKVCTALNSRVPVFQTMDDLSIGELALAVHLVSKLKRRPFGIEVKAYVASEAQEEGYVMLPEVLSFAQEQLDSLMQGTPGPEVRDELRKRGPMSIDVTDEDDPVHLQAGLLQAVAVYLKTKDTHEVSR